MEPKDKTKYARAKKRVEDIKGFYIHLSIYLTINGIMLLAALGVFKDTFIPIHFPNWSYFTTPFFWGIVIVINWLYVFKPKLMPFRDWEERKIKQFMEEEEKDFQNNNLCE